jgi:eukaryotic-like serine/threonine-protein kinase
LTDFKQLADLETQGKYGPAAALAERLGRYGDAARLWERACRFDRAAEQYLAAAAPDRATLLAARLDDPTLLGRCLEALAREPRLAALALPRLENLGLFSAAARLSEQLADAEGAAARYERARQYFKAARLHQTRGDEAAAIRCLQLAVADEHATALSRLALALLWERRGQYLEATRLLQSIPTSDPLEPLALLTLERVLAAQNLQLAAREVRARLGRYPDASPSLPEELRAFAHTRAGGAPSDPLLFGRYEVLECVANTPTAKVYKAFDRVLEQLVAVKLFSPAIASGTGRDAFFRFEQEVEVLRELRHPNIVPLVAYHPEGPAVVLRWMAGGSLGERLAQGSVTPEFGAHVASRILSALAHAHRRGILHRDVKPDNILFDVAGIPYLADFGMAHVADHSQTVTRGLIGTLAYMAPAQRRGYPADVRADIYSVGAVFWHVLSGAPPEHNQPLSSENLGEEQRRLARSLIDPEAPTESASEAQALIERLTWPRIPTTRAPAVASRRQSSADTQRLVGHDSSKFDCILERPVIVLESTPEILQRARCFASADHAGLSSIFSFDPRREQIWVESLPTQSDVQLSAEQRASLASALRRLHEVSGCHGCVDPEHLGWRGDQPVLLFPTSIRAATLGEDLARLADL